MGRSALPTAVVGTEARKGGSRRALRSTQRHPPAGTRSRNSAVSIGIPPPRLMAPDQLNAPLPPADPASGSVRVTGFGSRPDPQLAVTLPHLGRRRQRRIILLWTLLTRDHQPKGPMRHLTACLTVAALAGAIPARAEDAPAKSLAI